MSVLEPRMVGKAGMGIVRKKVPSKEQVQKHVRLDPDVHRDVEHICAHTNREYNDVINLLLRWAADRELEDIRTEVEGKNQA